ncbi:shikimate kinase [Desulfolithobacter dissulfuricans]|nr:shikimate kinase [Desulfolithobacter dissulfuricans]
MYFRADGKRIFTPPDLTTTVCQTRSNSQGRSIQMSCIHSNIILIGMAGAGKSTVGRLLADRTGRPYIDTDDLISAAGNGTLQDILDRDGLASFQALEERVLLNLSCLNHVIATGGSVIYSRKGMAHLKKIGWIVFLDVDLDELEKRVRNQHSRGLINPSGIGFDALYRERLPLYNTYCDLRIRATDLSPEEICEIIVDRLERQADKSPE